MSLRLLKCLLYLGCTTVEYLSIVMLTVDQIEPLRDIWTKGRAQGRTKGWTQFWV